jgi:hypothetical protein
VVYVNFLCTGKEGRKEINFVEIFPMNENSRIASLLIIRVRQEWSNDALRLSEQDEHPRKSVARFDRICWSLAGHLARIFE